MRVKPSIVCARDLRTTFNNLIDQGQLLRC